MLRVANHYPTTVTIDGEPVKLRIVKFDRRQDIEFSTEFDFVNREQSAFEAEVAQFAVQYRTRLAATKGVAVEAIADADIPNTITLIGLLEASLTPEAAAARRAREVALAERGTAFAVKSITDFVSVEPGQIYDESAGREVLTGADLIAQFSARDDVRRDLLVEIVQQNRLSSEQKKRLSWLRDFKATSPVSSTDGGPRPADTVDAAAPSTTAPIVPASALPRETPSGATPPLSATSAPSSASRQRSSGGSRGSRRRTISSPPTGDSDTNATASPTQAGSGSKRPN